MPITPSLSPLKSFSAFYREEGEGTAFSSMFQPSLSSSMRNGHESLWRSLDDNELQRSGAEREVIIDRKDFESTKSILKDLSWATTASPLTPDIFTSAYQAVTPSFPLPHLLSLDEADDIDLTTFSPRTMERYSNTIYSLDNSMAIDDRTYLGQNLYPSNLNYTGEIIYSDIEDLLEPSFSSNYFPSENNISGDIAIDLLSRDEVHDVGSWGEDMADISLNDMTRPAEMFSDINKNTDDDNNRDGNGDDSMRRNGSTGKRVSIIDNHSVFTKDVISRLNNNISINKTVSATSPKGDSGQINGHGSAHSHGTSNGNSNGNISDGGRGMSGGQGGYFSGDPVIRGKVSPMTHTTTLHDTSISSRRSSMYTESNGDNGMNTDNSSIIQSIDRLNRLGLRNSAPSPDGRGSFYGDRELFSESDAWLQRLNLPQQPLFQRSSFSSPQSHLFDTTASTTSTSSRSIGTGTGTGVSTDRTQSASRRRSGPGSTFKTFYGDENENEIENENENENENEIGENDDWLQDISSWGLGRMGAEHDYSVNDNPSPHPNPLYSTDTMIQNTGMGMGSSSGRPLSGSYQSYNGHQGSSNHQENDFEPSRSYFDNSMSYDAQHHLHPSFSQAQRQEQLQLQLQHAQQQLQQQHQLDMQQLEQEINLSNTPSQHRYQHQQHQQHQHQQHQHQHQLEQTPKPKSNIAPPPGFEAHQR